GLMCILCTLSWTRFSRFFLDYSYLPISHVRKRVTFSCAHFHRDDSCGPFACGVNGFSVHILYLLVCFACFSIISFYGYCISLGWFCWLSEAHDAGSMLDAGA